MLYRNIIGSGWLATFVLLWVVYRGKKVGKKNFATRCRYAYWQKKKKNNDRSQSGTIYINIYTYIYRASQWKPAHFARTKESQLDMVGRIEKEQVRIFFLIFSFPVMYISCSLLLIHFLTLHLSRQRCRPRGSYNNYSLSKYFFLWLVTSTTSLFQFSRNSRWSLERDYQ